MTEKDLEIQELRRKQDALKHSAGKLTKALNHLCQTCKDIAEYKHVGTACNICPVTELNKNLREIGENI